jgi:hypothetical protein
MSIDLSGRCCPLLKVLTAHPTLERGRQLTLVSRIQLFLQEPLKTFRNLSLKISADGHQVIVGRALEVKAVYYE